MTHVSISQVKINPSQIIAMAEDFPVAIESRSKVKAYILGKDLYERLVSYIEDTVDKRTIEKTDFSEGEDFEKIAKELNL